MQKISEKVVSLTCLQLFLLLSLTINTDYLDTAYLLSKRTREFCSVVNKVKN